MKTFYRIWQGHKVIGKVQNSAKNYMSWWVIEKKLLVY